MASNISMCYRNEEKQKNIQKNRELMLKVAIDYVTLDNKMRDLENSILVGINSDDKILKHSCENMLIEIVFKNMPKDINPEKPITDIIAEMDGDNVILMKLALHYNGFLVDVD